MHENHASGASLFIWAEIIREGHCSMSLDEIAERADVCRNSVRAALKAAQALGIIKVTERRFQTAPNAPNVVRLAPSPNALNGSAA